MNYLTNYYKNLSEQLQTRINHLQKIINEEQGSGIFMKNPINAISNAVSDLYQKPADALTREVVRMTGAAPTGDINQRKVKISAQGDQIAKDAAAAREPKPKDQYLNFSETTPIPSMSPLVGPTAKLLGPSSSEQDELKKPITVDKIEQTKKEIRDRQISHYGRTL